MVYFSNEQELGFTYRREANGQLKVEQDISITTRHVQDWFECLDLLSRPGGKFLYADHAGTVRILMYLPLSGAGRRQCRVSVTEADQVPV